MEAKTTGTGEDIIYRHILTYLDENGYKIISIGATASYVKGEPIIAFSKSGYKEVIEVKNFLTVLGEENKELIERVEVKQEAKHWLSEVVFSFLLNFRKYSRSEKTTLALALPNTERYRQIVENVKEYFTANNLNLKVYMVAESGTVEVCNLNENYLKVK